MRALVNVRKNVQELMLDVSLEDSGVHKIVLVFVRSRNALWDLCGMR